MEAIFKRDGTKPFFFLGICLENLLCLGKKVAAANKATVIHSNYFSSSFVVLFPFHIPCE